MMLGPPALFIMLQHAALVHALAINVSQQVMLSLLFEYHLIYVLPKSRLAAARLVQPVPE